MLGGGPSGGGERFTGRAAIGHDHCYDAQVFYLALALDERYVEGWVEGCLERIVEDYPEEERLFRDPWADESQREEVVESLKVAARSARGGLTGRSLGRGQDPLLRAADHLPPKMAGENLPGYTCYLHVS